MEVSASVRGSHRTRTLNLRIKSRVAIVWPHEAARGFRWSSWPFGACSCGPVGY
jgi:hypothetical protein